MVSEKAKDLISTLSTDAAWSVGVTSPNLKSRKELEGYIQELEEMLRWYIEEDEIHEGDPENQYWIDGKHTAMKLLGMEIEE